MFDLAGATFHSSNKVTNNVSASHYRQRASETAWKVSQCDKERVRCLFLAGMEAVLGVGTLCQYLTFSSAQDEVFLCINTSRILSPTSR